MAVDGETEKSCEGVPGGGEWASPRPGRQIRLSIVLIVCTSMSNGEMRSPAADLRIRYTACWRARRPGSAGGPSLRTSLRT